MVILRKKSSFLFLAFVSSINLLYFNCLKSVVVNVQVKGKFGICWLEKAITLKTTEWISQSFYHSFSTHLTYTNYYLHVIVKFRGLYIQQWNNLFKNLRTASFTFWYGYKLRRIKEVWFYISWSGFLPLKLYVLY